MSDVSRITILELEYKALRAEIIQSISYQHQILLSGYGAAGAVVGYAATKSTEVLIIIPFIFIGMASLWIVECNRMVRASFYIAEILWPSIKKQPDADLDCTHWPNVGWESWIRYDETIQATIFRDLQNRWQHVVVIGGPIIMSAIALLITSSLVIYNPNARGKSFFAILLLIALLAWFWFRVVHDFKKISKLDAI